MDKIREQNIANIAACFQAGCKSRKAPVVAGLELEHFVVDKDGRRVPYAGTGGVEEILEALRPFYEREARSQGHLIGLGRPDVDVSIEPAGQLEVSISPQMHGKDVLRIYGEFRREVETVLQKWDYRMVESGYQPTGSAEDLSLIPKKRYEYMDRYFRKLGPYGCYMMRGTAATQVSIDFYDEEDCVRKYKAAYGLYPFMAALTDNSPVFEGRPYETGLLRTEIWQHADPARTDIFGFLNGRELSFRSYAEFVYQVPLIVKPENGEDSYTEDSCEVVYRDRIMSREEIDHALSMVFPHVRLKNYLEIRYGDSLPPEEAVGYMFLLKGLFGDIGRLEEWLRAKGIEGPADADKMVQEIRAGGGPAQDMRAGEDRLRDASRADKDWLRDAWAELLELASGNLGQEDRECLLPIKQRIRR